MRESLPMVCAQELVITTYKNKAAEQTPNFQIDCKSNSATTSEGSKIVNITGQN